MEAKYRKKSQRPPEGTILGKTSREKDKRRYREGG